MKLKKPGSSLDGAQITTKAIKVGENVVIYHQQSIRQSHNYQSAECVYGVTLTVPNSTADIDLGFKRATRIVEENLVTKLQQQKQLLEKLGANKE